MRFLKNSDPSGCGHGVYYNDLMIGLVADDVLYLKAEADSSNYFSGRGLEAFEYVKNTKTMKMSYFMAPEEIYENPEEAKMWAERAYAAAVRSRSKSKKKKSSS